MGAIGVVWTTTQVTVTTAATVVLVANLRRSKVTLIRQGTGGGNIFVGSGASVTTANGILIPRIDGYPFSLRNQGDIYAIMQSGGTVTEVVTAMEEYI